MANRFEIEIKLPTPDATELFARTLAPLTSSGDTILLEGEIGAGKSHFARAFIRQLLGRDGENTEIPSPTYTLVQTYESSLAEVWHADLYRIGDESEVPELGLDEAMSDAIVLIEWSELLGSHRPQDALTLSFSPGATPEARNLAVSGSERFRPAVENAASKVAQGA